MLTRPNSLPMMHLHGTFDKIPGCHGPYLSENKGMDAPCCARCMIIRLRIYKGVGIFFDNRIDHEYFDRMVAACPGTGIETSFAMSQCGEKLIVTQPFSSQLEYGSCKEFLRKQFLLRKELGLVLLNITGSMKPLLAVTTRSLPVILPIGTKRMVPSQDTDEGVEIKSFKINEEQVRMLAIKNATLAAKSGKWSYLIEFYRLCTELFDEEDYMSSIDFVQTSDDIYYRIF